MADFIAQTEASTGARLPRFVKDEFDAFLQCGILAHGFLRRRCGECGHDTLLTLRGAMPREVSAPAAVRRGRRSRQPDRSWLLLLHGSSRRLVFNKAGLLVRCTDEDNP